MDNAALATEVQKLSRELEAQRNSFSHVIGLIVSLSNAVNEGFNKVNERLSILEGKQGMQGVNAEMQMLGGF